jgi:hypothetical protein
VEAYEFRQAWSVAKIRGTRKLRRRPRKVVCLRKKGTSEEDTRRREGGSAKERFRVSSTKKFLFLVNEYLGSERPVSFEYRLLRDFVYEEAMCEGSSGNGLPYAAKAVP